MHVGGRAIDAGAVRPQTFFRQTVAFLCRQIGVPRRSNHHRCSIEDARYAKLFTHLIDEAHRAVHRVSNRDTQTFNAGNTVVAGHHSAQLRNGKLIHKGSPLGIFAIQTNQFSKLDRRGGSGFTLCQLDRPEQALHPYTRADPHRTQHRQQSSPVCRRFLHQ